MREKRLLKTELKCLKKLGFRTKFVSKNSENEFYYISKKLEVSFLFDTCSLCASVGIYFNGEGVNIFDSDIFEETKRDALKTKVENTKKLYDINALLLVYIDFIKNNLPDIEACL